MEIISRNEILNNIHKHLLKNNKNVLITGPLGCGKTIILKLFTEKYPRYIDWDINHTDMSIKNYDYIVVDDAENINKAIMRKIKEFKKPILMAARNQKVVHVGTKTVIIKVPYFDTKTLSKYLPDINPQLIEKYKGIRQIILNAPFNLENISIFNDKNQYEITKHILVQKCHKDEIKNIVNISETSALLYENITYIPLNIYKKINKYFSDMYTIESHMSSNLDWTFYKDIQQLKISYINESISKAKTKSIKIKESQFLSKISHKNMLFSKNTRLDFDKLYQKYFIKSSL